MKSRTKIFAGIAAFAIIVSTAGAVFADSGDGFAQSQNWGQGRGDDSEQDGLLDDYMAAAMADVLGLTVEELQLHQDADETFIDLALLQGFAIEDVDGLMDEARSIAVEMAAADGVYLGRQEANQISGQYGAMGQGGRVGGQAGFSQGNMNNNETCDCGGVPLYENAAGESMMRRGSRQ